MKEFSVSVRCDSARALVGALRAAAALVEGEGEAFDAMAVDDSFEVVAAGADEVDITRHA